MESGNIHQSGLVWQSAELAMTQYAGSLLARCVPGVEQEK